MIKNHITQCREARNLRKSQLAYYVGMSRSYVTKLEQGQATPGLELALQIARCLKKPVEEIFRLEETGTPVTAISNPCPAADGNNQQRRKTESK
jgi:putative transcriptional regulator